MTDARYASDLRAAAQNLDGTYSLPRAMAWMSEVLNPGQGVPEARVRELIDEAKHRASAKHKAALVAGTAARAILPPAEPERESGDAGA
jgi:hypothetical protein